MSIVASFIYTDKIIRNANEGYALLQKCWLVVEKFLTFGFCPTYAPFVKHNGYFCTDLRLPYWGDIFIQPGKLSDSDSEYIFLRSWWQTKDIDALIASQEKLGKNVDQTWDIEALRTIKEIEVTKDEKAKTPAEREKSVNTKGGVELITGFQKGVKSKFYTFHIQSTQKSKQSIGTVVRTKINKDPRGELPVSFAYGDIDGSNPLGRGIIDLVGPLQNLMDAEMQMYQYNRALQLNPPLIKRGSFSKNKIKFAPNIIIDVGSSPDATVEPLKIDTTALANFPNNYGLMKSQLLNLLASPDTSISADIGNPGFSKTPQGVEASRANLSVDDNYVRKQFETWFSRWSETAINLYFAERKGIEELQLDDEAADSLRQLETFDQSLLSDDNKIRINYSTATQALKFEVIADSSKSENDPAQQAIAENLLGTVMKFPMLNSAWGGPIDVDELAHAIVETSGIDNQQLIAPEMTKAQKQAKAQAKQKPNGFSPMFDKPKLDIRYPDLPPAAQVQLLGLAGIQVTMQDVLTGPVADVNARAAVTEPIIDPNILVPGGGQAQQAASPDSQYFGGAQPPQQVPAVPVTADHFLKANQQAHQQQMDKAKFVLDQQGQAHDQQMAQAQHQLSVQTANQPQTTSKQPKQSPKSSKVPTPPQVQMNISPQDQQFIQQLQQMGMPDQQIGQALAMLHHGVPPDQIIQMLQGGQTNG